MATLSSLASIVPEPSVSNRSKASLISCFCSSVSPCCCPFFPLSRRAEPTALRYPLDCAKHTQSPRALSSPLLAWATTPRPARLAPQSSEAPETEAEASRGYTVKVMRPSTHHGATCRGGGFAFKRPPARQGVVQLQHRGSGEGERGGTLQKHAVSYLPSCRSFPSPSSRETTRGSACIHAWEGESGKEARKRASMPV